MIEGVSAPLGNFTLSTSDFISVITSLVDFQTSTSTTIFETQTDESEVYFFTHFTSFIFFSNSSVIRELISVGLTQV
jgi:hypothetical protein